MAKQKVVIKVMMVDAKKRAKGLETVARLHGVISVEIDGEKIVVVGDGIDPVALTVKLRKKMGFAELLSVSAVEEKKDEKKDEKNDAKKDVQKVIWPCAPPPQMHWPQMYVVEERSGCNDPCRIM